MPSEERLHPTSVFFVLAAQVRSFAFPLLFAIVGAGWAGFGWQLWTLPFAGLYVLSAVLRYVSFRYRYEESEMVIRSGILFRNERHVPYARIQNLDAVQNVFHRLLGVVEVRVETGGGTEPEAKMSVLPVAAFEEMRRRVFSGRSGRPEVQAPAAEAQSSEAAATASGRTLLHLPPRELVLLGLMKGRGGILIGAALGLLWELGFWNGDFAFWELGDKEASRGAVRALFGWLFRGGDLPLGRIGFAVLALVGLLVALRIFSVAWTLVRYHGYRLTLAGDDLRTEYGLLTRVVATIPVRRIQTLSLLEGPFARRLGRAMVRVETAGGAGGEGDEAAKKQREWLAPIIRRADLPAFVQTVIPDLDLSALTWRPAPPRAYRREFKGWLILCLPISIVLAVSLKWWALPLIPLLVVWAFFGSRRHVRHLGWAVTEGAVLYRSGWLWRQITAARFSKIQAVTLHESPFDRRHAMARVRVDTAGAGDLSHRVDIPYLGKDTAIELQGLLAARAAGTELRW